MLKVSNYVGLDVEEIADWIAEDSPLRAERFIEELWNKLRYISANPLLYSLRPDLGAAVRLAVLGQYVIVYRVLGDVVRIERVVDGRRLLPRLIPELH